MPRGVFVAPHLDELARERCERSLAHFTKTMWPAMDPAPFVDNWHLDVVAEHLQAVAAGEIRRLIINIPPRHSKSLTTGVSFPAWAWTQPGQRNGVRTPNAGPQVRFLNSSYAHQLAVRDAVKTRRLLNSKRYRYWWHERFSLLPDQNAKGRYDNDVGGYRLATSVDGGLTGEGGDIIIIDDPHNVKETESEIKREAVITWWREAMSTRLNDQATGAYVLIMQRVHERDLVGHILAHEYSSWTHVCLPARYEAAHPYVYAKDPRTKDGQVLWPARLPEPALAALESTMGAYAVAGQMQQLPAPREGGLFKKSWFPVVNAVPAGSIAVRGWDLAATEEQTSQDPDWTYGAKIYKTPEGRYIIADLTGTREGPGPVERLIKATASQDGKSVAISLPQDPGQAGKSQIAYLKTRLAGYVVLSSPESGSKTQRAAPLAAQAEAGNVSLLAGEWNAGFLDRIALFPNGAHDDDVDACSRAFNAVNEARMPALVAPIGVPVASPYAA